MVGIDGYIIILLYITNINEFPYQNKIKFKNFNLQSYHIIILILLSYNTK